MKKFMPLIATYLCLHKCMGLAAVNSVLTQSLQAQLSEDGLFNFTELSKKYIRPAEEYDVTTEDGYILKLFRVPGNTSSVVLFCHGVLQSSDDYLIRGNASLLYMMAEKGFDVWAMNFRGNRYSRSHVALNPDTDSQFWEFSFHEIGIYDYKANIDFILKKTGQRRLSVVGHSEGTTTFFVLASERPEYNQKVKVFVGLAPITYFKYCSFAWVALFRILTLLKPILDIFKIDEVLSYYSSLTKVLDLSCSGLAGYELCFNIFGAFTGFNQKNIEYGFASTILGHFPVGTSRKNFVHYAYNYIQSRFAHYDYGLKNFEVYGSYKPPSYDVKQITTNVAMYAAKDDKAVTVKDVVRLRKELPNVVHYQVIDDETFNHFDFVWGRNAHVKLYPYVIEMLQKYN